MGTVSVRKTEKGVKEQAMHTLSFGTMIINVFAIFSQILLTNMP